MDEKTSHILVVDDDKALRELLQRFLHDQGFSVSGADGAAEAEPFLTENPPDLLVLDVMMPGETGLSLLERLRGGALGEAAGRMPVLMLTAMGEPEDRIQGLSKGADDYLSKPFEPRELVLRIRNILSRMRGPREEAARQLRFGPFRFDLAAQRLMRGEAVVYLTSGEAQLMAVFASHPNETLSRDFLSSKLPVPASDRTIDVQVTRLRKKLEDDPRHPAYLETVRHQGYILRTGGAA